MSHHHYDHGGGLKRFFEINSKAKVYLSNIPDGDCYAKVFKFKRYIGLDKLTIKNNFNRLVFIDKVSEILPNVFIFPHINNRYPKPDGNKFLYLKKDNKFRLDNFNHEIAMAIKEKGKIVVFTGCAHNGVLNIIDTVVSRFKDIPIKSVVGGFHLVSPFPLNLGAINKIKDIGKELYPIDITYTGHCTSPKAFKILKSVMGDKLQDIKTGTVFEV